jgi:uncharacterized OsmC-like protein
MQRAVAVETGAHKYVENIAIGPHTLQADEPVAVGGQDSAPNPYELLLGALGACTAITVQMFAERHRWPLEKVHVELSHAKAHAADCANCTAPSARLDRVDLTIRFEGTLSDEQRSKLMDVAMHCPLHRTLAAGLEIDEREA